MRRVNNKISVLVILTILMIGIGYAAITTTLTITGNTGISGDSSNFQNNVFFYSADLTSTGLRAEDSTAAQPKLNGNTMKFTVPNTSPLKNIGDKIEVNYTIRNESNYVASIAVPIVESTSGNFLDYFNVTHSRTDNLNLGVNETSSSQKLTLTLKKTYADTTAKQIGFIVKINATAIGSNIIGSGGNHGIVKVPESFETDDWNTLISAVQDGDISTYKVGDTRTIDMGSFGTHTIRIANTTTPTECANPDFSQTACGFVLEFADVITTRNMNPAGTYKDVRYNYGWNKDGFPASSLNTYLQDDIYEALPEKLRDAIIETKVISGYGSADTENFTSTNKLYLLAPHEIWEDGTSNKVSVYDKDYDYTRQLDYYASFGVTTNTNYNKAIKQYNGSNFYWWLRSAYSDNNYYFYSTRHGGDWGSSNATATNGISPAFRIG